MLLSERAVFSPLAGESLSERAESSFQEAKRQRV